MYATLFDRNYLLRGLTMIESLHSVAPDSQVTVLALDWETANLLSDHQSALNLTILGLGDLDEPELWSARQTRCYRDFCWTLSSVLCHRLLQDHEEVIYLDADLLFLSSPNDLINQCRAGQIAAIPHDFPERLRHLESNGRFNVQWVYFSGPEGRVACEEWRQQCLERCELAPDEGVVGDQKYLDQWPATYRAFVQIDDPGCGVGPWNHELRQPTRQGGHWRVSTGQPLVFFHFHGLRIEASGEIMMAADTYSEKVPLPPGLYSEYLERLASNWSRVQHLVPEPDPIHWRIRRPEGRASQTFGRLQDRWRTRRTRRTPP